jgi:hypothetical protein
MIALLLAAAAVSYADVKPVLDAQCATCHHAVFDLSQFPFQGSAWDTQEETVAAMIARMQRTDRKRMPPPRAAPEPLPAATVALFQRWLDDGLMP